jgi:hypothetical protein
MKTLRVRTIISAMLLCAVAFGQQNKPLILVKDGEPKYSIVTAARSSVNENRAAKLLQEYIQKISGATLPIYTDQERPVKNEIIVGFSDRTKEKKWRELGGTLAPDGYQINTEKGKLLILGGKHKGTIYGVVELLEKYLGCRKYSPTVEYVPQKSTIALARIHIADQPANTFRVVYGRFSRDEAYKTWQRLDNVDDVFADGFMVHTLGRLIPSQRYFKTNPEYFALVNGKRIIDQPCLSNPEVLSIVIEELKKEMAEQPDKNVWSVSQNDIISYCQCPACRAAIEEEGSPAGPIIRFVNKVAEQFPDKIISTLAYEYSRSAPKATKPRDNVQIMLCTIELNRSKSIESDTASRQFVKDFSDWGKISKHIYLWDYTVNFSHHVSPFPNLHVLQPNIQFFTRNGAHEQFQQSDTDVGHEFSELKSYLISRLLWNPAINADSVIDDFLDGYYGKAAPSIRRYIERLEAECIRSGERLDIFEPPMAHAGSFISADNMATYNKFFDEAEASVKDQPEAIQRVKVARLPIEYAAMEIAKDDMFGSRGWYRGDSNKFTLRPDMKNMLEDFYATCKANGVQTLKEAGLTPEEYYKTTLLFIDVKVDDDIAFRKKVVASPMPSPKYSKGDPAVLTNGVQGANDYRAHWLGWEHTDFQLTLDLDSITSPHFVNISTLYDLMDWILHPVSVKCEVSSDSISWIESGTQRVEGDQKKEETIRNFRFTDNLQNIRYVRFSIAGIKSLPAWYPSVEGDSWVFVDEIVVK